MKGNLIILLAILLALAFAFWLPSCSVARRIDWHEKQLDKYEKLYPEMFTTAGIDSIIKARALELVGQMTKEVDPAKIDSLETELVKLHKWVAKAKEKGIPCDTILVEIEKIVEKEGKAKILWKEAPCKMDTIKKDSAGVHVRAWGKDGKLYMKLSVDSMRIKYDCPPEPKCIDREWLSYWQSILSIAFLVLMFGVALSSRMK